MFATKLFLPVLKGDPLCNETCISVNGVKLNTSRTGTLRGLFPTDFDLEWDREGIQLRFVQLDHRGGHCDCWSLTCGEVLINSSGSIVHSM